LETTITISDLTAHEIPAAYKLVCDVFDAFVASDYSELGRETFYQLVTKEYLAYLHKRNGFSLIAKAKNKIVGILSVRDTNHITLFFVDKEYQHQGIGKQLFDAAKSKIKSIYSQTRIIDVHSSPYAEKIYGALGFVKMDEVKDEMGIRYVPMEYKIV